MHPASSFVLFFKVKKYHNALHLVLPGIPDVEESSDPPLKAGKNVLLLFQTFFIYYFLPFFNSLN